MREELLKICPACKETNMASEMICIKCGADISSVNIVSESEGTNVDNEVQKEENRKTVIDNNSQEFKDVFASELTPKRKIRRELYPRTKEDEEAEKIIADIKKSAVKTAEELKKGFAGIIKKIKKR